MYVLYFFIFIFTLSFCRQLLGFVLCVAWAKLLPGMDGLPTWPDCGPCASVFNGENMMQFLSTPPWFIWYIWVTEFVKTEESDRWKKGNIHEYSSNCQGSLRILELGIVTSSRKQTETWTLDGMKPDKPMFRLSACSLTQPWAMSVSNNLGHHLGSIRWNQIRVVRGHV